MSEKRKLDPVRQLYPRIHDYISPSRGTYSFNRLEPIHENKILDRKVVSARGVRSSRNTDHGSAAKTLLSKNRSNQKDDIQDDDIIVLKRPATAGGSHPKTSDNLSNNESILHTVQELVDWLKSWKDRNVDIQKVYEEDKVKHDKKSNSKIGKESNKRPKSQPTEFSYVPFSSANQSQKIRTNPTSSVAKNQKLTSNNSAAKSVEPKLDTKQKLPNKENSSKSVRPGTASSKRGRSQLRTVPNHSISSKSGKVDLKVTVSERKPEKIPERRLDEKEFDSKKEICNVNINAHSEDQGIISNTSYSCELSSEPEMVTMVSLYSPLKSKHKSRKIDINKNDLMKKLDEAVETPKKVTHSRIPRRKI